MKTMVPVDEAVGIVLPHDITEIRAGEFKGPAFRKGHIIRPEDISHLKDLGKERIYVLELGPDEVHEDEAALTLAGALCGPGTSYSKEPVEGKVTIKASYRGLLKINKEELYRFNLLGEVMCATLHDHTPVEEGDVIGGTRLIPLLGKRHLLNRALDIAGSGDKIIQVLACRRIQAGLVIVGNEIFYGRIQDAFAPILERKIADIGSEVISVRFAPDNPDVIAAEIRNCLKAGADLIIASGGMSVDPDDVTCMGIADAGATDIVYGTPVLPGAMFLVGYLGAIPVLGLPACGMFHKITVFDLILPRILAGERITREKIASLGHGGLCRSCRICRYPFCGLGH